MSFAAVILDMDGTLLDTEAVYLEATIRATRDVGYATNEAFYHSLIGLPGAESDRLIVEHFGPDFPFAAFDERWQAHRAALFAGGIPRKPGAVEMLEHCAALRLPRAVATSSRRATAEAHLATAGLRHLLDAVVGRDDVARGKPHPDVFLVAAQRLGVAAGACLAVEDSRHGALAAHAAGMAVALVPDLVAPTAAVRALCRFVLADLAAVRALLGDQAPAGSGGAGSGGAGSGGAGASR